SFDHVSFRYDSADFRRPSRLVVKDMSFTIPAGSVTALVGKSGCGKTTVFRLISKLLEATEGTVRLDGVDIRTLDKDSIRENLTVVSQNPYLFHMTIRENLRLVKRDVTEEEMKEVCRLVVMDEEISHMPEGYDTLIGEGGVNLSGGQRQRLAIARGILRDCRILLFDEATSALDNITQSRVQKAVENIRGARTIVMIAHRLSTVINADRILFMEDGRILDQGTHPELLARCDAYRALYEAESNLDQAFSKQNDEEKPV
ncbi:MAG: ATP-binding cassette domain-containing protein, partial [Flexilinea sp.]|nr:ATP-binding cassette domain-containing protein [Flexilinea sp.]